MREKDKDREKRERERSREGGDMLLEGDEYQKHKIKQNRVTWVGNVKGVDRQIAISAEIKQLPWGEFSGQRIGLMVDMPGISEEQPEANLTEGK